jgi:hypothetical protein
MAERPNRTPHTFFRLPMAAVVVAMVAAAGLSACGSKSQPASYMAKDTDRLGYLQWNKTDQALAGTLTLSTLDPKTTDITSEASPFTGSLNGSTVTLKLVHPVDGSSTWSGPVSSSSVTLSHTTTDGQTDTLTFTEATTTAYHAALIDLKNGALEAADAAATSSDEASAKKTIDSAGADVKADIATLSSAADALAPMAVPATDEISAVREHKDAAHQAQIRAAKQKNKDSICQNADEASAQANAASGGAATAASVKGQVDAQITVVKKDITALGQSHARLTTAQAALPSYHPKAVPTEQAISDAISSANDAIAAASHSVNTAVNNTASNAGTAQSFAAKAQESCTAAQNR